MKIKIIKKNKNKSQHWWYDKYVGEEFKIAKFYYNNSVLVYFDKDGSKGFKNHSGNLQIFLEDTNYHQMMRKKKLKKINAVN